MGIILFSIPFFLVLIALEVGYSAWSGRRLLRLNDSIADLACGILSQLSGVFTKLFSIGIYIQVERHLAVQRWLPGAPGWPEGAPFARADVFPFFAPRWAELASWVAVFILVDFAYYWSHRLSHGINLLWAGHVVHHSSEEYNLAVALRQSSLHGLMTWVFYVPLALVGVPWRMYVAAYALNLVYQFWIHTRAVGKLGRWTELVMNTPSHHRVHHGSDPEYLDKNYAGIFIIWDRMFGTFVPENEKVQFGLTKDMPNHNPLRIAVNQLLMIRRDLSQARTLHDVLGILFKGPEWWSGAQARHSDRAGSRTDSGAQTTQTI